VAADLAAIQRRFVEEYQTGGDVAVGEELLADDFVDHTPFGTFSPDKAGVLALFAMLRGAFPDFRAEIHLMLEDGDKVVTRKTFHGTHRGDFVGIPPTGRTVAFDVIDIVRITDGKVCEHWNVVDAFGLMHQLGAA
jgi:steroid delta-isomerase-like uncharacterized protein